jgi:Histidine kinase
VSRAGRWPGWEIGSIGAIVVAGILANVAIVLARPAMTRAAVASVDSTLTRDRAVLGRELLQWRDGMLDDGRWEAGLVTVLLDAHNGKAVGTLTANDVARLQELTVAQIPTARVWVFDREGHVRAATGVAPPSARHRWLALTSLARDTTLIAATEQRGTDLRLAVGSPVRSAAGRGLTVVLDLSAGDRLRRKVPSLALAGDAARAAVTFPFGDRYVGATWTGAGTDPKIGWPLTEWALSDSALIVVGGALPDTSAHFELGVPRATARVAVDTRVAWWRAGTALAVLSLCTGVLLIGRTGRNARLHAAEKSLGESQLRAAQAEVAATRAGLAAIQARLNPHFLSNALHSVAALIATEPEAAEDTLDRLGDLFRYSLEQSERGTVSLDAEWRFVRDYLAIEQMRLGARLRVEMVLDPDVATAEVPPFILQPLVENAIRHGIGPRREGGLLRVTAVRKGARVELTVDDDGQGADAASVAASAGTSLRTLRERLALDGAAGGQFEVETAPNAGFRIRVTLAGRD